MASTSIDISNSSSLKVTLHGDNAQDPDMEEAAADAFAESETSELKDILKFYLFLDFIVGALAWFYAGLCTSPNSRMTWTLIHPGLGWIIILNLLMFIYNFFFFLGGEGYFSKCNTILETYGGDPHLYTHMQTFSTCTCPCTSLKIFSAPNPS
eukprot:jgi/Botrbrau1/19169/Bobra.0077s0078.1